MLFKSFFLLSKKNYFVIIFLSFASALEAQPYITGLTPASGATGSSIAITGTGFSVSPSANIVNFAGVRANVTAASAVSLSVTVPSGTSPSLPVTVNTNGLTGYSPYPFTTTFPGGSGPLDSYSFTSGSDITTASNPKDIVTGDIDGDGKPDLVSVNYIGKSFSVYKNSSTTTSISFQNRIDFPTELLPYSIAMGDVDGDGLPDIVIGTNNGGNDSVLIYRNTSAAGTITFTLEAMYWSSVTYSILIGEVDGDGKPDIIASNSSGVYVYHNTSTSESVSFSNGIYFASGQSPQNLAIMDVNGNGKPDVISCNGSGTVSILDNLSTAGSINFAAPVPYSVGNSLVSVAAGDLDGDGKPDIAVVSNSGYVYVLKNTGNGSAISFANPISLYTGYTPWGLELADINGDGKKDIITPLFAVHTVVTIFRNISNDTLDFDAKTEYNTGDKNRNLAIADFRNTGVPDIATIKQEVNKIGFLRNRIEDPPAVTSFSPAAAGQGFDVTINGTNLSSVTAVSFGGVAATSVTVVSNTVIKAMVGAGASGNVSVTTPAGTADMPGFTFTPAPSFTSFSPSSGPVGQKVKITGSGFADTPSGNIVYFGGSKATVISASTQHIERNSSAGCHVSKHFSNHRRLYGIFHSSI